MTNVRYCCQYNRKFCRIMTKVLACVVVTYAIVMKSYVRLTSTKQLPATSVIDSGYGLVKAIASRASSDRYIVLAMVDESFTDMAINLHEASFRPNHIDNYLFVGVGNSTCEVVARHSLACFHYVNDPDAHHSSTFGTVEFFRKMNIRTDMILEALDGNFTVLHTDLDVSFLSNPMNEIKVKSLFFLWRTWPRRFTMGSTFET